MDALASTDVISTTGMLVLSPLAIVAGLLIFAVGRALVAEKAKNAESQEQAPPERLRNMLRMDVYWRNPDLVGAIGLTIAACGVCTAVISVLVLTGVLPS